MNSLTDGVIQPSHLTGEQRSGTKCQRNLAKITELDCDEILPRPRREDTGPGIFAGEGGWGAGAGGRNLPCGQDTSSQKAETPLYRQAEDGRKCRVQPKLGKTESHLPPEMAMNSVQLRTEGPGGQRQGFQSSGKKQGADK